MRLGWYARRLASMSPAEMAGRARDELTRRRWRGRQVTDADADPAGTPVACPAFAARLPVGGDDVPEDARVRLKEAAEGLLGGRWPVLGRERDDMAPAPDWFLDPTTGRRAPDRTYCFDIDYRDPAAVGDVKQVWEPSRHQHLTVLAAAYHLDGDERYAQAVATQLRSWWAANPFLSGIHWTSGIELGVRLLSWIWIRRLLDGWPGAEPLFEGNRVFLQQLHHHQEWLIRLPSHGSSANNHLLAEMAGQFAAACAFPWFPESTAWRETAAPTLERELARQTFACGLNRELATGYHGFVLELGLAAALEGELAGHRLGGHAWDSLRRMTDALAAVVDVRLRPPRQGDGDDGHGLLLDGPGYDRWASLLATGAALFGPAPWWPAAPWSDVRTALWTRLASRPLPAGARPARRPSLFPDAGMAILRDHDGRPDELWCRADHGPHGYLSIAAHAHADALAIEFRVGGVDLLADPGTYCYAAEPTGAPSSAPRWPTTPSRSAGSTSPWRPAPTCGPARPGPCWSGRPGWTAARWPSGGPPTTATAASAHRPSTTAVSGWTVGARQLVIEDRLDTVGAHDCRLAFHLGPEVACALEDARAILEWRSDQGRRSATLALPDGLAWRQP